ncbi:MAG: class I mannose-6-phosphate isomerase [Sphingomonadaceae bacterium]|nr:class I mannose-6-phosphate isomerase [Sphingomonadaceae bacterium]
MSGILPTRQVEKPWGKDALPAPFSAPAGQRIGEIWFEPPEALSQLLVKYIFTSEKLSVQVHPSDEQTLAAGLGRQGKEECWLVIDAEPDASLGIGLCEPMGPEAMHRAALDGSIEQLMAWHDVSPGDFFYIPAGTIHAIGPGISLIEVQQNSDITYRLFDYGRPRELHLEEGIAVARGERFDPRLRKRVEASGSTTLVDGPLFRLDQVTATPDARIAERYQGPLLVIPRDATALVAGEEVAPGKCALALDLGAVTFARQGTYLIAQPCRA